MDRTNPIEHQDETTGAVTVDGTTIRLDGFVFDDPTLASLLADLSAERRIEMVGRVLTVGARGLVTMGLGVDLGEVDERVRTAVRQAAEEAERRFTTTVNDASRAMSGQLDPNLRDSLVARSLEDFTEWRDDFLAALDPNSVDSHTRLLLENLESLVGPDGLMETRLHAMLDPSGEESALGQLGDSITRQLADLRDLIMVQHGARQEATKGTRKGFEFEDTVEDTIRSCLAAVTGAWVDRTSDEHGPHGKVGDFVVTVASGQRIVIEAKNSSAPIRLGGTTGILAELDKAAANRNADFAICVSAEPVFPPENGLFGLYGSRLCVVDDGEGVMLQAALSWAQAALALTTTRASAADMRLVDERLQALRGLAQQISNAQRSLTGVSSSVATLKSTLDEMRSDLLAHVDDIRRELNRGSEDDEPTRTIGLRAVPGTA